MCSAANEMERCNKEAEGREVFRHLAHDVNAEKTAVMSKA